MRKPKRKYTRKTVTETPPDAPKLATEPLKPQSSGKTPSVVTEADVALLPPSLRMQLEAVTRLRERHQIPDNLKERIEQMVRRFRGY